MQEKNIIVLGAEKLVFMILPNQHVGIQLIGISEQLGLVDTAVGIALTSQEARVVAQTLLRKADEAEGATLRPVVPLLPTPSGKAS